MKICGSKFVEFHTNKFVEFYSEKQGIGFRASTFGASRSALRPHRQG